MREGWKEVKLGEITSMIKRGVSPKYVEEDGIVVINQKCVRSSKINFEEARLTSKVKKISDEKYVKVGDVLVNSTGTGTLGRTGYVSYLHNQTTVDTHVTIVRSKNEIANSRFIGFVLSLYEPIIENLGKGATNQIELSAKDLASLKINLPPLETQRKIASILSGYDDLIENNLKRIKILEEMAQQTYEEWFVRMRFPGYETAVMNEETGLPEGWEKVKLGEIYDLKYGKNLAQTDILKEGTFSVYGASGKMGYFTKSNISSKKVLVTSRGNGSGVVHRTFEDESFVTNNSFVVNTELGLGYTFYNLKKFDLSRFNSGSAQPQLTNSALLNVEIIRPNSQLINDFNLIVNNQIQFIDNLLNQNQRLREARDLLLPRLMMGIVEV